MWPGDDEPLNLAERGGKDRNCRRELAEVADGPIGSEVIGRHVGVPEAAGDHGNRSGSRGCDVDARVADHDGSCRIPAGKEHDLTEMVGVGFVYGKRVPSGQRPQTAPSYRAHRADRRDRSSRLLVQTARRSPCTAKLFQRLHGAVERPAVVGDVGFIICQKEREQAIDLGLGKRQAGLVAGPRRSCGARRSRWRPGASRPGQAQGQGRRAHDWSRPRGPAPYRRACRRGRKRGWALHAAFYRRRPALSCPCETRPEV